MGYIIETEHIRVRRFETTDAERLFEYHRDDEMKWFPNEIYADIDEARDAIVFFSECADKKIMPYVLGAELKETGELIGDIGISDEGNGAEIGYVICREHRGKGYACELVGAMQRYACNVFGTLTMYGRVVKGNDASARVLEKSGFIFVGEEYGADDDPHGNGMLVYRKDI